MKRHLLLILIAVGFSSFGNSQTASASDSSKVDNLPAWCNNGKSSSEEIAIGVVEFLRNSDTSQYMKHAIPLEGQKLIHERDFDPKIDIKEYHQTQLDSLNARYTSILENFLVRSGYIHEIMIEDKDFYISKAVIDTIIVEKLPANMFRGKRFPKENWNMVTVVMEYNKEKFYFEIPQIVELDYVNSFRNKN